MNDFTKPVNVLKQQKETWASSIFKNVNVLGLTFQIFFFLLLIADFLTAVGCLKKKKIFFLNVLTIS